MVTSMDDYYGVDLTAEPSSLLYTAIHDGGQMRSSLRAYCGISEAQRYQEEDPGTGVMLPDGVNRLVVKHSRFELDLNRDRASALYLVPEDSWGLKVWRLPLPEQEQAYSRSLHDTFYQAVASLVDQLLSRRTSLLVMDIHSFNPLPRLLDGKTVTELPDMNLGTASVGLKWQALVGEIKGQLERLELDGTRLVISENTIFKGGYFVRWLNGRYGDRLCAIAVEINKDRINDAKGRSDPGKLQRIKQCFAGLNSRLPGLLATTVEQDGGR